MSSSSSSSSSPPPSSTFFFSLYPSLNMPSVSPRYTFLKGQNLGQEKNQNYAKKLETIRYTNQTPSSKRQL
jgi:hypothetical protein